jgi:hypothetical protein
MPVPFRTARLPRLTFELVEFLHKLRVRRANPVAFRLGDEQLTTE